MAYDTSDYDRVKHTQTATAFARLREVTQEQQRREGNAYIGGLADRLRAAFTEPYGHIDAEQAAALLLEHFPRFERF